MRTINDWLTAYGVSHQNHTNKLIHWICVPAIMFSLLGLLYSIPFPVEKTVFLNWAGVFIGLTLLFYLRLSVAIFLGFVLVGSLMLWGNHQLAQVVPSLALTSLAIFALAWIGQFIGHKIEGQKPSFFEDLQFLLIGPAWLLHFIYKRLGIPY